MKPYPCDRCHKLCGPYERIEKRIEFRDARTQSRYATYVVEHICKTCADEEIAEKRPEPKQGTFL